jgi:hypothetical protein
MERELGIAVSQQPTASVAAIDCEGSRNAKLFR